MDSKTDSELVKLAADGNQEAFSALIDRHYMFIYKVAYKFCGTKEDAEDIAQNVCVKLARKLELYKADISFTSWLYQVVANTFRDFYRQNKRSRNSEEIDEQVQVEAEQEKVVEGKQYGKIIQSLPEKLREAVVLVYSEGLSHAEAGRILDCAETTISWRIFQAKKKLRRLV